jgi:hypothetical protein
MGKKIVVDGVEYEPVKTDAEKLMIVCVDNRGLTFIGRVNLESQEEFLTIRKARCIIYWGTSQHISELVSGPTSKTRLGKSEDVIVQKNNIIFAYEADPEGWK